MKTLTGVITGTQNNIAKIKLSTGAIINIRNYNNLPYGQKVTIGLDLTGEGTHQIIDHIDRQPEEITFPKELLNGI